MLFCNFTTGPTLSCFGDITFQNIKCKCIYFQYVHVSHVLTTSCQEITVNYLGISRIDPIDFTLISVRLSGLILDVLTPKDGELCCKLFGIDHYFET